MADASEPDPERLAAYRKAIDRLPVLTRVIFQLVRLDDLPYCEIACRLSIDVQAVEACIVEALRMIRNTLDGEPPRRSDDPRIVVVEAGLHQRHRAYCEDRLQALDISAPVPWTVDGDDDQALMRAFVAAMPSRVYNTFILNRVERLTVAQIAQSMGTYQWIVRHRMLRAIRHIARGPATFERWLRDMAWPDSWIS